ncbi:uncharacterized protein LOC121322556 [Polyodon spathula]|uniref:uncharacterized protein LOC121322556 n=1 Tax=Polyodon spathula TaxID=7913 RepID=UPI001B7F7106|nr:uncharacterized protein LOC121322556 [Polyodon spathula]
MLKPNNRDLCFQQHVANRTLYHLPDWNSGTMDSNRRLLQVIREMRSEMKKLECENKELRRERCKSGTSPEMGEDTSVSTAFHHHPVNSEETASQAILRRNLSAPVLERQYKENIMMTVRRYSISSNPSTRPVQNKKLPVGNVMDKRDLGEKNSPLEESTEETLSIAENVIQGQDSTGQLNICSKDTFKNRRLLKQYVHKCKAKVKSVSFLLPVDDSSYSEHQASQNYLQDQNSNNLSGSREKDL